MKGSWFNYRQGQKGFLLKAQTGPMDQPAYSTDSGSSFGTSNEAKYWRLRMCEAVTPFHHTPSCLAMGQLFFFALKCGANRRGSGRSEKIFETPSKGGLSKSLETASLIRKDWLTVTKGLGFGRKFQFVLLTNNDTTDKDKNICNVFGSRATFRTAVSR